MVGSRFLSPYLAFCIMANRKFYETGHVVYCLKRNLMLIKKFNSTIKLKSSEFIHFPKHGEAVNVVNLVNIQMKTWLQQIMIWTMKVQANTFSIVQF